MQTTKRSGIGKVITGMVDNSTTVVPHRTTNRITAKQMRDFDARIDRVLDHANQVRADLKKIGRK